MADNLSPEIQKRIAEIKRQRAERLAELREKNHAAHALRISKGFERRLDHYLNCRSITMCACDQCISGYAAQDLDLLCEKGRLEFNQDVFR